MKKGIAIIVILAAAGAGAFYYTGGSFSALTGAKKSVPATLGSALSSKTTAGFVGIEDVDTLVSDVLKLVGTFTKELPSEIRAGVEPFLNKNGREGALGFDPVSAAGWSSVGIDAKAGFHLSFDHRIHRRRVPRPIVLFKVTDRAKLVAALGKKNIAVAFSDKKGPSEILTVIGRRFLIGQRGGYTAVTDYPRFIKTEEYRGHFNAYLSSTDAQLSADKNYGPAFRGAEDGPRIVGYASMSGIGEVVKNASRGAVAPGDVSYYVERFPSFGMGVSGNGLSAKLVASPAGTSILKKLLVPKQKPALAQYIPSSGWSAVRYSLNLAQVFDGLGDLVPPSKMELKMGLSMGQALVGAQAGMTWPEIAQALSGHLAVAVDTASFLDAQSKGPGAVRWLGIIGVGDTAKADTLLKTINQKASMFLGGISGASITVDQFKGVEYTLPIMKLAVVRASDAILVGPGKDAIASALKTAKGTHLGSTPSGKLIDKTGAFVVSSIDVSKLKDALLSMKSIPADNRESIQKFMGTKEANSFLSKPIVSTVEVNNGLYFEARSMGGMGVLTGMLASIAIPSFVGFQKRAKTSEARMNLRKVYDSSAMYYMADKSSRTGEVLPKQFPLSVETPPHDEWYAQVCKDGKSQKFKPTAETWSAPTWQALNFAVADPFYYKYTYEASGTGPGAVFTIRVTGDLDCDGTFSTFQRVGTIDGQNNVRSSQLVEKEIE